MLPCGEQCASCIFRTDGKAFELAAGRLDQIRAYLVNGTPHVCHGPAVKGSKKRIACRGGRDFQLLIWSRMGIIEAPTDEALVKAMSERGISTVGGAPLSVIKQYIENQKNV